MKKLLLAVGLTAFFGLAQAQSSVTIYGLLDAGYIGGNYKGIGTTATSKQTANTFGQSAESYSRLGFKGTEDLGGGTSAFFTVETQLNPDNATLSTFNNRQTFVGLRQAGIGRAAVGTQFTPIFNAVAKTDAAQANNLVGNAIYAAAPQGVPANSGTAPYAAATSSSATSDAFTIRTANTLSVTSDTISGFTGTGFLALNNQNATQTSATAGGTTSAGGWGLGVNYEWQKLLVTANYQALKSFQSAATLTSPAPALWAAAGGGANTQDNQTYVAGVYDFGILKAYAQYINRTVTDTLNSSYAGRRSAEQIGVRGYITPRVEGWVSAGLGSITAFGVDQPAAKFTAYQLGSNYWLSKRTNLYAIYGATQTASISTTGSLSSNNYALGLRHTF